MEVKLFYKIISLFLLAFIILFPARTSAKPKYAEQTSQNCETCHIEEGGPLTQTGFDFAASGYRWPPPINLKAILPLPKFAKVLVGFLHILTAFAWFGTIIYVHIIRSYAVGDIYFAHDQCYQLVTKNSAKSSNLINTMSYCSTA